MCTGKISFAPVGLRCVRTVHPGALRCCVRRHVVYQVPPGASSAARRAGRLPRLCRHGVAAAGRPDALWRVCTGPTRNLGCRSVALRWPRGLASGNACAAFTHCLALAHCTGTIAFANPASNPSPNDTRTTRDSVARTGHARCGGRAAPQKRGCSPRSGTGGAACAGIGTRTRNTLGGAQQNSKFVRSR